MRVLRPGFCAPRRRHSGATNTARLIKTVVCWPAMANRCAGTTTSRAGWACWRAP